MSYCISYDQIPVKLERLQKKRSWKKILAWVATATCALMLFIPRVRLGLLQILLPGLEENSLEALDALAEKICNGEPLGKALEGFCVEVFSSLNG